MHGKPDRDFMGKGVADRSPLFWFSRITRAASAVNSVIPAALLWLLGDSVETTGQVFAVSWEIVGKT
jgi:hypothetical protein